MRFGTATSLLTVYSIENGIDHFVTVESSEPRISYSSGPLIWIHSLHRYDAYTPPGEYEMRGFELSSHKMANAIFNRINSQQWRGRCVKFS